MRAKVYSYLRFSDAKQAAGASSERQQAYAKEWARKNGLTLDESLSMRDEGLSAYHQKHIKRGALGAFLQAVEEGKVPTGSVLVVEGLDRLSRAEPIVAQGQLAQIINAGITVVTASDSKAYSQESLKANPMDLVYSLLVMIRAHEESDTKSKRVRDAIRRMCRGWIDGTYKGLIRYGQTPGWLRVEDGRWTLVPERAEAYRLAVDRFRAGHGLGPIVRELHERGLSLGGTAGASGHLLRMLVHPALKGEKRIELDGETFTLEGYYPPVISPAEWDEVQLLAGQRSRKMIRNKVPAILTGFGVTICGYCGKPKKTQTMVSRMREDGSVPDGNRRLQCTSDNTATPCPVRSSCSAAPIERALMRWCSDMLNLQSLYSSDATAAPRAAVAAARAKLARIDTQLERLTEAMLDDSAGTPQVFVRRARALEDERQTTELDLQAAERALADAGRFDLTGSEEQWRDLAAGVEALDSEARLKARQLIADTFEQIVVYRVGIQPDTPKGTIDILLRAKGGKARLIQINKKGELLAGAEFAPAT